MNANDLNAAMQYIDDTYLDIADAPQKEIIQMTKRKTLTKIFLIAAIIAMLAVTAYAADFMRIQSLVTGTSNIYNEYSQVPKAMRQAGFKMDIRETFGTGYAFELIRVQDTNALDENNHKVFSYKELSIHYRNEDRTLLVLCAAPNREEIPEGTHAEGLKKEIAGIPAVYYQDHYKLVPEDYELTEADKLWMEQPGNYLSYGSDEVEEQAPGFLEWEKDGIHYFFMDMEGKVPAETLFTMAEELITGK